MLRFESVGMMIVLLLLGMLCVSVLVFVVLFSRLSELCSYWIRLLVMNIEFFSV